jgi:transcriptional regulator with XRE-family HTH domain
MEKNKFREFCTVNNLTAAEVAKRIGVSKYTVYAYFRGERLPGRRTMKRMEAEFGIDTRRMFG